MIYFFLATPYMYNTIYIFRIYAHICLVWLWFQTYNLQMCCGDHFDEHFNCYCLKRMAHDSTGNKIRAASFCLNQYDVDLCRQMASLGHSGKHRESDAIFIMGISTHACIWNINASTMSIKPERRHDTNFIITGGITGCHNDNQPAVPPMTSWQLYVFCGTVSHTWNSITILSVFVPGFVFLTS